MQIGLLICDHIREEYQYIAPNYAVMYQNYLPAIKLVPYYVCDGQFPEKVEECVGYMMTGSRYSVYEQLDWVIHLKAFVKAIYEAKRPYFGVCFGHQMLAEALGGKVRKAENIGWCVGVHTFDIKEQQTWMTPLQTSFNLLMMCQDQVMDLPPESKVLATTSDCKVGMFQVGEKMVGIQAHPEFSKHYNQVLMEARIKRMGAEKVASGITSLQLPVHDAIFREWIYSFFGISST